MVQVIATCGVLASSGATCPAGYEYIGPESQPLNATGDFASVCCVSISQLPALQLGLHS